MDISVSGNLGGSLGILVKVKSCCVTWVLYRSIMDCICQLIQCLINPLPDDKILNWFKLKQIADGITKCI